MATSTTRSSKAYKSSVKQTTERTTEKDKTFDTIPDREGNLQSEELESHHGSTENSNLLVESQARSFNVVSKPLF